MSFQAYLDAIEDKTGLTPRQLVEIAHNKGFDDPAVKAGAVIEWLAADYSLGRGHATTPCQKTRSSGRDGKNDV